ncbi:uncharacterized protein LOC132754404 [Ruditapes philippinarum]|uniref:uncharacterized protein LOC132754404 n=1 Tax=Ruditapes philippinarum TaxID=129788 RepID=UPI00295BB4D0|nr:uncharacterized protein LOC132754404 [Ruditapes philippinarum]
MYAIQLCTAVVVVCLLCVQVETSCWFKNASPDENGNFPTYCDYQGWVIDSNTTLKSPAPYCETCTCLFGNLNCCGYGKKAGAAVRAGCTQVDDDSSCDLIFVNSANENLPCDNWSRK